jgi:2-dehydropantoate 2-reductase
LTDAKTVVVTLQNGLGNEEILRDTYPDNQLVLGMSTHTVITIAPGHYRHTGVRDTYLGPSRDEWMDAAGLVGRALEGNGFPVHVLAEHAIRTEQWGKFVANCAVLPVSALTRLGIDDLLRESGACALMDEIVRETCRLAIAEGIALEEDERVGFLHDLLEHAGGRASMLGDVLAGRRTEIETINGAALRVADRHSASAPLNRAMYALVKGLDRAIEIGDQ